MTAVEPTTEPASNRSRREVLCGLVVALVAPGALVTACGDLAPSGSGTSTPTTGGGGSTGTAGGGTGGGAGTGALAALTDVPEGGGLVVNNPSGGKLVLVRQSADQVLAYDAACTHQGTTVNAPRSGVMVCPNHGSQFSASDGSVKRGPATSALRAVEVKVEAGNIVMA